MDDFSIVSQSMAVEPFPAINQKKSFIAPHTPDKSMTHRAIMFAAMAQGTSIIDRPLLGDDCLATCEAFRKLGVEISISQVLDLTDVSSRLSITSPGADHWKSPADDIDLGNSGTSARLLAGLFSGISTLKVTLDGDSSLRHRPMGRIVNPLRNMGANISGEHDGDLLKLTITGSRLIPRKHVLSTPSAQIKSALLLAGASAAGRTEIELPEGGRNHSEVMMAALGAQISTRTRNGQEQISLDGVWRPRSFHCQIPNDPSSIAFFAGMAAIHPGLEVRAKEVVMNRTRIEYFRVLKEMGVAVEWSRVQRYKNYLGETVGDLRIFRCNSRVLCAVTVTDERSKLMLDEIPILAVVASFAEGESKISGLQELKVKESDRLNMIKQLLICANVECNVIGDDLFITGREKVGAFSFKSDDHRMLMSAITLASRGTGESKIEGIEWIRTSFPLFITSFQTIKNML